MPSQNNKPLTDVAVVGAGIAGLQAALDLAAMNHKVYLIERSPTIGGNMGKLDKTFPTNDCSMCMLSPRMVAGYRHENIEIITMAELVALEGEVGRFRARVKKHPRYIDEDVCIGCGLCVEKCPRKTANEYNALLDKRKAVHFAHSQAIPLVPRIDTENCIYFEKGKCKACEKFCPVQAVRLHQEVQELEFDVGAVILAVGFGLALVHKFGEYGHGRYPNVVTSLDFERMLSATGPFGGKPLRPSDSEPPKKVAWIQCVASRDAARGRNFCSSVCCMAAVKQAIITKEHDPEAGAAIFYMDIRAQGKGFDSYVERARDHYGVRFVRSTPSQIVLDPASNNLLIHYYDREKRKEREEEFDLVVLSAGMEPAGNGGGLISMLGLEHNPYGFIVPDLEEPTGTSRSGVFVCGTLDGPKDIPESVAAASASAASAATLLREKREITKETKEEPAERDVSEEEPRIGVFVCHCGKNIAGVIDVESLRDYAKSLPNVEAAEDFLFTCSTNTLENISELIEEHRLNRVVVAACSPRTHEPLFQETLRRAGLNKYLFEMANIRDQCSWVHREDGEKALEKAKDLIRSAVAKASLLGPVKDIMTTVVPRGLVIGGGLAGMTAALTLADMGLGVTLVEKGSQLGGYARNIYHTLEGFSPMRLVERRAARTLAHRNITVLTNATVTKIDGGPGSFTGVVRQNGEESSIEFGAIIVATGGSPYEPREYFYGEHPGVLTQAELEKRLFTGQREAPGTTVMIQCVGSRNDEFPMCSRVCCSAAVKNAIQIKKKDPESGVYVLFRDLRTFGFKEDYYKEARDLGVFFVKYSPEEPPKVSKEGDDLRVEILDMESGMKLDIRPDLLVLSSGIRPSRGARDIARMLKLPTTEEGFFLEDHPKLRPLDMSSAGVFLCGLAHSPRFVEESLAQAKGAASKAAAILLQKDTVTSGVKARVDPEKCIACLVCVRDCPYRVPVINEDKVSYIDPRTCQGCGICVAECPAKAIEFRHHTDDQIMAKLDALCTA